MTLNSRARNLNFIKKLEGSASETEKRRVPAAVSTGDEVQISSSKELSTIVDLLVKVDRIISGLWAVYDVMKYGFG